MGLFDRKSTPEQKSSAVPDTNVQLYRIAVTTNSETYNFMSGHHHDHCVEEVKKIFSLQYFRLENLFIPVSHIKKIDILKV